MCAFWKCVGCLCVWSIMVAIFHWVFSKDCAARRRESTCLSKSGRCEVWGLRPARRTEESLWLMQKLWNEHVTLSAAHCHRTSTHIHSSGEKLLHHIWFTIWRQRRVRLVLPTPSVLWGQEFRKIRKSSWDACFYFIQLEKELLISHWIGSQAYFQPFFFRLKMSLIDWNSDSYSLTHTHSPQLALTCPPSVSSAVAGFYISLSNHVLGPSGPEPPSVMPVTCEGISVFITSVKAAVLTPSLKPPWRGAAASALW